MSRQLNDFFMPHPVVPLINFVVSVSRFCTEVLSFTILRKFNLLDASMVSPEQDIVSSASPAQCSFLLGNQPVPSLRCFLWTWTLNALSTFAGDAA